MKTMNLKVADGLVVFGGGSIGFSSLIKAYSVNEWVVIGIIVGIVCSVLGCLAGIVIRCLWLRARVRILKDSIKARDAQGKPLSSAESILLDSDRN
ncbi:hypothetical protein CTX76_004442 [Salmonella enterica subsp. houtenae]|nr:hypothetical protein [Salmonella enterica subsp. enterica serovar Senftenberg]EAB8210082.1 hypothetical protein [Salmonella enterica subsp. enterica serovar Lattenkamp]EAO2902010.1 hypothetical protein [Salmonella enterica]EBS5897311.1 hypothetical protein [Salmonella enterica subsp. enterica serovar Fluntern]EBV1280590.1 hypothetical protein [Salmonella enterica subsp. enterica serovar Sandiego]EBW1766267.1 hypothetical protein [Salmonella enterica subsp. enterica serovar Infantis]EBZ3186